MGAQEFMPIAITSTVPYTLKRERCRSFDFELISFTIFFHSRFNNIKVFSAKFI